MIMLIGKSLATIIVSILVIHHRQLTYWQNHGDGSHDTKCHHLSCHFGISVRWQTLRWPELTNVSNMSRWHTGTFTKNLDMASRDDTRHPLPTCCVWVKPNIAVSTRYENKYFPDWVLPHHHIQNVNDLTIKQGAQASHFLPWPYGSLFSIKYFHSDHVMLHSQHPDWICYCSCCCAAASNESKLVLRAQGKKTMRLREASKIVM